MSSSSRSTVIVQKYGGSSVADAQKVQAVAHKIKRRTDTGEKVVVVVSAMGNTTNEFILLAREVDSGTVSFGKNGAREMDNLMAAGELVSSSIMSLALQSMGVDALSLSGAQAGIRTDSKHMSARIANIKTERITRELEHGRTVIVAGFQGVDSDGDVTTLGRGGSDTSAVALAIALNAKQCEIYTDVDGIYTTDPRFCDKARLIKRIRADEMLEMANLGAKMNPRSIELAAAFEMPVYVLYSAADTLGTLIDSGGKEMEIRKKTITGIAVDSKIGKLVVTGVKDRPGVAAGLLRPLSTHGISVSAIVQNTSVDDKTTNFTFIVGMDNVERARILIQNQTDIVFENCIESREICKISIVGTGVTNSPEYATKMFETLAKEKVNIDMITTSEISISCIVESASAKKAVNALHNAFELDSVD